jgi:PAS domain-containing protein
MPLIDATTGLVFGLLTAAIGLWWVMRRPGPAPLPQKSGEESLSFLFENGTLVDASEEAEALLTASGKQTDWAGITQLLKGRFLLPDDELTVPVRDGVNYYSARDSADDGVLEVRKSGNRVRLDLFGRDETSGAVGHKMHLMQEELETLRNANDVAPFPIWQVTRDGAVAWHNPAYAELYRKIFKLPPQPDEPLFRLQDPRLEPGRTRRVPITPPNTKQSVWYDVQRVETRIGDFYSAVDANALVRAEAAQRNFVQTLAKTFAHLPIGLAIFDDNRQLVLFNPAVIDLTGLGADFLSSRPNLLSFFDELRNRRLMPEPKNYNSWRQQIADLVAAAADGRYSETWTLNSGRTYRVNGRPHPDGAIAFLIEDISSEVSLTRRFRAELELGQSVLDNLETGIAAFTSSGVLTVTNAAYRERWALAPDASFADLTVVDCMRAWQEKCQSTPVFGDLRDFVLEYGERAAWSANVTTKGGEVLEVEAIPLVSGSTMIRFVPQEPVQREEVRPEPVSTEQGT